MAELIVWGVILGLFIAAVVVGTSAVRDTRRTSRARDDGNRAVEVLRAKHTALANREEVPVKLTLIRRADGGCGWRVWEVDPDPDAVEGNLVPYALGEEPSPDEAMARFYALLEQYPRLKWGGLVERIG